jgi:hypothetical protein
MGCWNQTCGLSQLHIRHGQDVMVFALTKNNGYDSLCYTTPFWAPAMLPFYAKYNDYGGGEDCTGVGLNIVMNAIKEELIELPQGANQFHDIPVKAEGFNDEVFFEAVHEGRLFVKGLHERQRVHVEFVMFHMDVVNHILENRKIERYVGQNNGNTGWDNAYIEYTFKDVLADLPACVDHMFEQYADQSNPLRFFDPLRSLRRMNDRETNQVNHAAALLSIDEYRYSGLVRISFLLDEYVEANDRAGLIELLTEHLKALWLDGFMLDTRKFWSPQAGAGSQAQEPEGYLLLIDAMKNVLAAEKREYDEENLSEEELEELNT